MEQLIEKLDEYRDTMHTFNMPLEIYQEYAHKYTGNYTTEKKAINVIKRSKKGILTDENGSKYVYLPFVKSKINHRR